MEKKRGMWKWEGSIEATAENVRACLYNADRSRQALSSAREAHQRHAPGTVEGAAAKYQVTKMHAEVLHWIEVASHWQVELDFLHLHATRAAEKAKLAEDANQRRTLLLSSVPPVEHPGADDDGDAWEPESAYAELGGAVGGTRPAARRDAVSADWHQPTTATAIAPPAANGDERRGLS